MPDWPDYELIDFGADKRGVGRKLERFGVMVVDRPSPSAADARRAKPEWQADATYDGAKVGDGQWRPREKTAKQPASNASPDGATIDVPLGVPLAADIAFKMHTDLALAGQVGLFPEQFSNWRWIAKQATRLRRPLRVLNLFGYTGGSTLAAAAAGVGKEHPVEVTHVDASKPAVALARQNAAASGLAEAPVRWIVEDAVKYCRREVKRGSRYDAVVLDPPSYGHGPKGEAWRLSRDLPTLLELVGELTERSPVFLLATCHTPGVGPAELSAYLSDGIVGHCGLRDGGQPPASGRLSLTTRDGRKLPSGAYARWPS